MILISLKPKLRYFQEPKMEMEPWRRVLQRNWGYVVYCLRQEPKQEEGLEDTCQPLHSLHLSVYCHCILLVKSNN